MWIAPSSIRPGRAGTDHCASRKLAAHLPVFATVASVVFLVVMACALWSPAEIWIDSSLNPYSRPGIAALHSSWGGCLQDVARGSGVDPALFRAIVKVESGMHPYAFGWHDASGIWRSYRAASYPEAVLQLQMLEQQAIRFDVGLAQVNSRNLKTLQSRTGISSINALDPCTNLYFAGVILREQMRIHGATWKAVAGYNGALAYAPRVHRVYCAQVPQAASCRRSLPLGKLLSLHLPMPKPSIMPPAPVTAMAHLR